MSDARELIEACKALVGIVEGIDGAMTHGTWRAEKSNLRMKDTDEWVAFYVAYNAALRAAVVPRVKPLVWRSIVKGFWVAETPFFGRIRVEHYSDCWTVAWSVPGYSDAFVEGEFGDEDSAKAAGEAEYQRRMAAALDTAPAASWQPISTAPKDGTSVLIGCDYDRLGKSRVTCAWFEEGMWVEAKHWDDDAEEWSFLECVFRPTHWMPLPAPPEGQP